MTARKDDLALYGHMGPQMVLLLFFTAVAMCAPSDLAFMAFWDLVWSCMAFYGLIWHLMVFYGGHKSKLIWSCLLMFPPRQQQQEQQKSLF